MCMSVTLTVLTSIHAYQHTCSSAGIQKLFGVLTTTVPTTLQGCQRFPNIWESRRCLRCEYRRT